MAMAAITDGLLAQGCRVKVLCMSTLKHPFVSADVPAHLLAATAMEAVTIDVRVKPMDAAINLLSTRASYNLSRFYSPALAARLVEVLQANSFDIIHLESLFCTPYLTVIRANSSAKIVLRAHNIEHTLWQRLAANAGNPFKRAYLSIMAARLKTEELRAMQLVDGIVPITPNDAQTIEQLGIATAVQTIPMGLPLAHVPHPNLPLGPLALYHVGTMDWQPNIEAVAYFLQEIWPQLHIAMPEVQCHFAGRHMPQRFLHQSGGGISIQGEVPSIAQFSASHQVMIVPLLSGGGMRIKIVEAMAMGKVVLSTSIGAEGVPYTNRENMLIADTPAQFVEQMLWLRSNANMVQHIGDSARQLAETHFDLNTITSRLTYFYRSIL